MGKVVNANIVAANAFLTTERDVLDKKQIIDYVNRVREKSNYKTDVFIGSFDVAHFVKDCDFAFNIDRENKYVFILTEMKDRRVLKGYFRQSLPKTFIKLMKETGKELLEDELKEILEKDKQKQKILIKE
jgi:hypothetical protein